MSKLGEKKGGMRSSRIKTTEREKRQEWSGEEGLEVGVKKRSQTDIYISIYRWGCNLMSEREKKIAFNRRMLFYVKVSRKGLWDS